MSESNSENNSYPYQILIESLEANYLMLNDLILKF